MIKKTKIKARVLKNLSQQIKGFMFCFKQKECLMFNLKNLKNKCIHMWFVFFPLYAIWLDEKKKVIQINYCKPFELKLWCCEKARWLIEIPEKIFISNKYNKKIKIDSLVEVINDTFKN